MEKKSAHTTVLSPSGTQVIAADEKIDDAGVKIFWFRVEAGPELKTQLDRIEALLLQISGNNNGRP